MVPPFFWSFQPWLCETNGGWVDFLTKGWGCGSIKADPAPGAEVWFPVNGKHARTPLFIEGGSRGPF